MNGRFRIGAHRGLEPSRRALLAALAGIALAPVAALAQDPKATTVQRVARDWLALVDALDPKSWDAAGPVFQRAITRERWQQGLRRERERRGKVTQRGTMATSFSNTFPGLPPNGSYALVNFRTVFEKNIGTSESVTLEQGSDGSWRVVGYVIG